jgi:epoxyqueuosine reductase
VPRSSTPPPRPEPPGLDEVCGLLTEHGVTHVGVTTAGVLTRARTAIRERRAAGLDAGMGFTYRDPVRSTDPRRAVPDARSVIVAARPYLTADDPPPPATGGPHARVGRYAWVDHYAELRTGLRAVATRLRRGGHRAVAFADDNSIVDRAVAHRAGLGWYGRNANLLLPGAGSFFVLGCVVTTAEYPPSPAPVPDGCGACRRCVDACPTAAIVAPGVVDGNRCLSWVLQRAGTIPEHYRRAVHDRIYGCDDCQDVCPISVRLGRRHTVDLDVDGEGVQAFVDAIELLGLDDDEIESRHRRWWIAGREMRWLRRNALVVLGNAADPTDREVRSLLDGYRSDPDPILAEHATWADARLDERAARTP